ncbi:zinc-ribbon domain-containing protein [Anaeromyxobacter oryzae]|uniref:zinc-ribbon domain-containing protein n=1 Tax=Anaeromyxobacter oryzae TaxID=2918170 RepID=UPI0021D60C91|nr:zinc-ribbon domain-containing protein [Anaeromyxobacter oryzae]
MIRCERCSTLYELDEALLAPEGSPVQCTRCQHVFTARPPQTAGLTLADVPAPREPAPEPPANAASTPVPEPAAAPAPDVASPAVPEPARSPVPPPGPASPPSGPRAPVSDAPRGVRAGPAVYRPAPGQLPAQRGPVLRRDSVGTIESRLRWSARVKWLVPVAVLVVVALAGAAWLFLANRRDPRAAQLDAEALALVAQDDAASLDAAVQRLDDAIRSAPRAKTLVADRALAQALQAAALAEDGAALAARAAVLSAERERLRREASPGWEIAERAVAAEADAVGGEVRAGDERARALGAAALAALVPLEDTRGPEVARALANAHALAGDRELTHRAALAARAAVPDDPWAALAEASLDARSQDRAAREKAAVALSAIVEHHPEVIRARYLLARTQAELGRRAEALATLDRALAANPHHDRAKALKAELSRHPAPAGVASPAPAASSPPAGAGNAAALPRKPVAQPVVVAPTAPPLPAPAVGGPQPAAPRPGAPAPDGLSVTLQPAPVPSPSPATPAPGGPQGVLVPSAAPAPAPRTSPAPTAHEAGEPAGGGG